MKRRNHRRPIITALLAAALIVSLTVSGLPKEVHAASGEIQREIDALKDEKTDIDKQIKQLQSKISGNREKIDQIMADKNAIDQEISLIHQQISNLDEQISSYTVMIADKQEEVVAAEVRLAALNEKNKERIRAMEEDGRLTYWSVLFKANSYADLLDRLTMIDEIASADRQRLKELSDAASVVANAKQELEEELSGLEAAKQAQSDAETQMHAKLATADELLNTLKAKGAEFEALLDESEDDQAILAQQIAAKEKDFKAAEYQEWLATYVAPTTAPKPTTKPTETTSPPETVKPTESTTPTQKPEFTEPAAPAAVKWIVPTKYTRMSSPFGYRLHPIQNVWKMHYGVDLSAPTGTPIVATRSGKVTTATYQDSAGNYVVINHGDGYSSVYMHMTHYVVSVGEFVTAGQVIGYVGSTGGSTGPHLHFGISYNGTYVNPADYIPI